MFRYTAIILTIFISGCGGCDEKKPLQNIEIKDEAKNITVRIRHFDQDLFSADFSNPEIAVQKIHAEYGNFFCDFVERDLHLAACTSDSVGQLLRPFLQNPEIIETQNEIRSVFSEEKLQNIGAALTESLQRWHHFFPDSLVPSVVFYQSAWNTNISASDSVIGISLDTYLGSENKITRRLSPDMFPKYMKNNMDEKYLVADAVKGWVAWNCGSYYTGKNLLSDLVFYGKLMYISEAMAPEIPDSTMMSWSADQLDWAQKHEWSIWKTIANEKVMFQTKEFEINKWFADGPFTGATGVPQDSPPQLGVWLGWNMVRDFMEKNPEISLPQLLAEIDDQKILAAFTPQR